MKTPHRAVYTAITNGYDTLLLQPIIDGCEYVVFTDDPTLTSEQWRVVSIPDLDCKAPKILRHEYMGEYDQTLWIDANIMLYKDAIDLFAYTEPFLCFDAVERHCGYEEVDMCRRLNKIDDNDASYATEYLHVHKHPEQAGMIASGVILRNAHASLPDFEKDWYWHVRNVCKRDQVTVNYLFDKHNICVGYFSGDITNNRYCKWNITHGVGVS
jgi:hypothetical protein